MILCRTFHAAEFVLVATRRLLPVAPFFALAVALKVLWHYHKTGEYNFARIIIGLPIGSIIFIMFISILGYIVIILTDKSIRVQYRAARAKQDFDAVHQLILQYF